MKISEKQLISGMSGIMGLMLLFLAWSLEKNFDNINNLIGDVKVQAKDNSNDIKKNFEKISNISARLSIVEP